MSKLYSFEGMLRISTIGPAEGVEMPKSDQKIKIKTQLKTTKFLFMFDIYHVAKEKIDH